MDLRASRRRLVLDGMGLIASTGAFGIVYGLSARQAGLSLPEAVAMSTLVFAGASQFAAVGYLTQGLGWPAIVVLTAFLNARHLLYSAALAPWLSRTRRPVRVAMAHVLTDEAFALSSAHFRRVGEPDLAGYWYAAIVTTFIPWNVATIVGLLLGGAVADPRAIGLDVVFPAAMGGLALGLATGRREIAAAVAGAIIAVAIALAWDPAGGILAGGLLGPFVAMLIPRSPRQAARVTPRSSEAADVAGAPSADAEDDTSVEADLAGHDPYSGSAP
ncbi:MAG TPA: AzlC family ABC transporter permease [Candidatus Dormibacteraeota bacterium]|nr:AzlC family ABC transporter permease [Candidatus Dormibacteraeota bacterium]